ncbi:hypothetical protein WDU94_002245 [Cyamophila willieti]
MSIPLKSPLLDFLRYFGHFYLVPYDFISDSVQPGNSTTPPQHPHFRNLHLPLVHLLHCPCFSTIHQRRSHYCLVNLSFHS